jgi:hypothetical protein
MSWYAPLRGSIGASEPSRDLAAELDAPFFIDVKRGLAWRIASAASTRAAARSTP